MPDDLAIVIGGLAIVCLMAALACAFCDYMEAQGHDRYKGEA